MTNTFKIGDKVVFNDKGLEIVFGSKLGNMHMKSKILTITYIDPNSMTDDQPLHLVEVDDFEINKLLLFDACFRKAR